MAVLLIGGLVGLLLMVLSSPPRFTLDVGSGGMDNIGVKSLHDMGISRDSLYLRHVFAAETSDDGTTFRWTSPQSQVELPGMLTETILSMRVYGTDTPRSGDSRLWLHNTTSHNFARHSVKPTYDALATLDIATGWRVYHVLLPPHNPQNWLPGGMSVGLATKQFCPPAYDSRVLGVPLDYVKLTPLAGWAAAPPLRPLLTQTILLLCGITLLVAGISSVGQILFGLQNRGLWAWAIAGIIGCGLWAWGSPYTLAWVCSPLVIGVAATIWGGVVVGRRAWHWLHSPAGMPIQRYTLPITVVLVWIAAHLLLFSSLAVSWRGGAALLILGLPGALLAWQWFATEQSQGILVRWFLAMGGGVAVPLVMLLGLHALPGALPAWVVVFCYNLLLVGGLVWWWKSPGHPGNCSPQKHEQSRLFPSPAAPSPAAPSPPAPSPIQGEGEPKSPSPACGGRGRGWGVLERGWSNSLFLLVLIAGAVLRLLFLGTSEFEGDEARAMLLAQGAMFGQDELPLLHKKGPVELLIPLGPMVLTGHTNELVTRLPLAIASLVALAGVYLLAQHMLRSLTHNAAMAGVVAAAVLAVDGFFVAYGRILQYQSIVVLMMVGAVWCCWRFVEMQVFPAPPCRLSHSRARGGVTYIRSLTLAARLAERGRGWGLSEGAGNGYKIKASTRLLTGAALFASVGLLSHYDYSFVLSTLALLVGIGGWRACWNIRQWVRMLALPVLVGGGVVLGFYLPFMLHENFQGTIAYLGQRAGEGGSPFYNNLPGYYRIATFYNTTYQIAWLGSILAIALGVWLVRYAYPRRSIGWVLAAVWVAGCGLLVWQPSWFVLGDTSLNVAGIVFGLPLAWLILSPPTPLPLRVLLVWFAIPFCAEAFLISDPRTHFYTMDTAAALLIGLALAQFAAWLTRHHMRVLLVPLMLAGVLLFTLAWGYSMLVFMRQMPEYKRMFPIARPDIYRASYGDELPSGGHYGHPHRDGWKAVGELYRQGVFAGDYYSNQMERISAWYTRGAFRCSQQPAYYFIGTWAASESDMAIPIHTIRKQYAYAGCVLVDQMNMLDVYSRDPLTPQPSEPTVYQLRDYTREFDAVPLESFPIQQPLQMAVPQHRLEREWQGGLQLTGYDLRIMPQITGQTTNILVTFMLNWQATAPVPAGYTLVVDMRDSNGNVVAQAQPLCNPAPPSTWYTAHNGTVMTPFQVVVGSGGGSGSAMRAGEYTFVVGLYNAATGEWLPLADGGEGVVLLIHPR